MVKHSLLGWSVISGKSLCLNNFMHECTTETNSSLFIGWTWFYCDADPLLYVQADLRVQICPWSSLSLDLSVESVQMYNWLCKAEGEIDISLLHSRNRGHFFLKDGLITCHRWSGDPLSWLHQELRLLTRQRTVILPIMYLILLCIVWHYFIPL